VTEHHPGEAAGNEVEIAGADTGARHLDDDLVRIGRGGLVDLDTSDVPILRDDGAHTPNVSLGRHLNAVVRVPDGVITEGGSS
jgi:hypothetical protein